jgi:hypothetical protein
VRKKAERYIERIAIEGEDPNLTYNKKKRKMNDMVTVIGSDA